MVSFTNETNKIILKTWVYFLLKIKALFFEVRRPVCLQLKLRLHINITESNQTYCTVQRISDRSPTESCCWMMITLQQTQSHKSTYSIRSWQFAGLTAKRQPMCHHHSLWFMLSCLPQTHWAPCLISLPASGLYRFILLPSLVIFLCSHTVFHFAEFQGYYCFVTFNCIFIVLFKVTLINTALIIFNLSSILSPNNVHFEIRCCQNLWYSN